MTAYYLAYEVFKETISKLGYESDIDPYYSGYTPGEIILKSKDHKSIFTASLQMFPALCGVAVISFVQRFNCSDEISRQLFESILNLCRGIDYTKVFISLNSWSWKSWGITKNDLVRLEFKELIPPFTNKRTRHKIYTYYKDL